MTPAGGAVAALVGAAGLGAAVASTFLLWHLSGYYERAVTGLLLIAPEEHRTSMWLVLALERVGFGSDPVGRWALAWALVRMTLSGDLVRTDAAAGALFRLHPRRRPLWQKESV